MAALIEIIYIEHFLYDQTHNKNSLNELIFLYQTSCLFLVLHIHVHKQYLYRMRTHMINTKGQGILVDRIARSQWHLKKDLASAHVTVNCQKDTKNTYLHCMGRDYALVTANIYVVTIFF